MTILVEQGADARLIPGHKRCLKGREPSPLPSVLLDPRAAGGGGMDRNRSSWVFPSDVAPAGSGSAIHWQAIRPVSMQSPGTVRVRLPPEPDARHLTGVQGSPIMHHTDRGQAEVERPCPWQQPCYGAPESRAACPAGWAVRVASSVRPAPDPVTLLRTPATAINRIRCAVRSAASGRARASSDAGVHFLDALRRRLSLVSALRGRALRDRDVHLRVSDGMSGAHWATSANGRKRTWM